MSLHKQCKKTHNFSIRELDVRVTIEVKGPQHDGEILTDEELKGNMIDIEA